MRKNKVFLCATLFFVVFALLLLVFGAIDSIAAASRTHSSLKTGTEVAFNPSDSSSTMSPVSSVASSVNSLVIDPTIGTDICPPQIVGAVDKEVVVGDSISYRTGVSVVDDSDEIVDLEIDSSNVDLSTPGTYPVTYSATDSSGNTSSVTVLVNVVAPPPRPTEQTNDESGSSEIMPEEDPLLLKVNALGQAVLDQILKEGMTQREKAYAIFQYVHRNIAYTGTSDKTDWVAGAYAGFTKRRGDCFTYFACSKVLLTLAGIPNVDLERVGGTTRHYWQLVDVGEGYMHFDACPHSHTSTVTFLLTEEEAREFSEQIAWYRPNYYVYDYENCPVEVVGTPENNE